MTQSELTIFNGALDVIHQAITPRGILASAEAKDNYARVWSRDSMITGITGLLCGDAQITAACKASILSLAEHQHPSGQIPSNVSVTAEGISNVSYGSLAGRVDATSWWICGACAYALYHPDDKAFVQLIEPRVEAAFAILKAWEFNGRGLIYTPLGGNWADEYVSEGYTLYDQALRIWALRLAHKLWPDKGYQAEATSLSALVLHNFSDWSQTITPDYHPVARNKATARDSRIMWSTLGPQGYDTRWDMAANSIALCLGLHDQAHRIEEYLSQLSDTHGGSWMLPVFYPVIHPTDPEWHGLHLNYSYAFKNNPYHFHNGGAWPVFLGWLSLGMALNGVPAVSRNVLDALTQAFQTESPAGTYHEYWSTDSFVAGGARRLCFSASGYILSSLSVYNLSTLKASPLFIC